MENNNKSNVVLGLIVGLSIIISTGIGSYTFFKLRSMDTISTTGSVKKSVISDKVKWVSSISRQAKVSTIKDGYAKMDTDLKAVKAFLAENGIDEKSIIISPVLMNENYDQNANAEKNYNLTQTIEVQSTDVNKIDALAKNTNSLINVGVLFSTNSLEYYYSKLPEARVELLASAVADAKARAEQLAIAGGKKIGLLKSATSGVVQVTSENSMEVSDYGMYDTSKINKEIMVTVKATFEIK